MAGYTDEGNAFDEVAKVVVDRRDPLEVAESWQERCEVAIEDGETDATLVEALAEHIGWLEEVARVANALAMIHRNYLGTL